MAHNTWTVLFWLSIQNCIHKNTHKTFIYSVLWLVFGILKYFGIYWDEVIIVWNRLLQREISHPVRRFLHLFFYSTSVYKLHCRSTNPTAEAPSTQSCYCTCTLLKRSVQGNVQISIKSQCLINFHSIFRIPSTHDGLWCATKSLFWQF